MNNKSQIVDVSQESINSELKIHSAAFEEGGWIPNCHSGYGEDYSPSLIIEGVSNKAVSMILTLDDLGHPIQPG